MNYKYVLLHLEVPYIICKEYFTNGIVLKTNKIYYLHFHAYKNAQIIYNLLKNKILPNIRNDI